MVENDDWINDWERRSYGECVAYLWDGHNNEDYEMIGDYYNGKASDKCWNVRRCSFGLSEFTEDDFNIALEGLTEDEARETMDEYRNDYGYIAGLIIAEEAFYECDYMGENIKENLTKEEADNFVKEYVKNN